ncbi:MAG TPA: DUF1254 domain-containing protein [Kofleriaceae bacterium]|nr:DUF1254 domain-containing protein [Kofleriaceae bacterium]
MQDQALEIGVEAVIYGLPLVMMELTMQNATNVEVPSGMAAPVNQFAHVPAFPGATFKQVVRANVDTLYSSAFLDLANEPIVLSVPDTHGRYYLLPMFDAWTNVFASPGTRTTGNGARDFVIVGPDWNQPLPAGLEPLRSPTNIAWILGRTQTNGPDDYAAVRELQQGYRLVPLSASGAPYTPPHGRVASSDRTPPVDRLKAMTATSYFAALARLMATNPPPAADAPMLAKLAAIGVVPGAPFAPPPEVAAALDRAFVAALQKIAPSKNLRGNLVHGWTIPGANLAAFGTDYVTRGLIAMIAFGANLPADAVYPTSFLDADGHPFDAAKRYVLHFAAGETPPVHAFWSITLYGPDSFFVANPIDRFAISSWMPLHRNADGSLDLYIQHESPGPQLEGNWLPAPASGSFNLTMRMYWPNATSPSILDGSWQPPGAALRP